MFSSKTAAPLVAFFVFLSTNATAQSPSPVPSPSPNLSPSPVPAAEVKIESLEEWNSSRLIAIHHRPNPGLWNVQAGVSQATGESVIKVETTGFLGLMTSSEYANSKMTGTQLNIEGLYGFSKLLSGGFKISQSPSVKADTTYGPASSKNGQKESMSYSGLYDPVVSLLIRPVWNPKFTFDGTFEYSPSMGVSKGASTSESGNNYRGGTLLIWGGRLAYHGSTFSIGAVYRSYQFGVRKTESSGTNYETTGGDVTQSGADFQARIGKGALTFGYYSKSGFTKEQTKNLTTGSTSISSQGMGGWSSIAVKYPVSEKWLLSLSQDSFTSQYGPSPIVIDYNGQVISASVLGVF